MNDAHDNAVTDKEMLARSVAPERTGLAGIVDQLTDDEATEVLLWLARHKPDALRTAFRTAVRWAPRVHAVYVEANRPHA